MLVTNLLDEQRRRAGHIGREPCTYSKSKQEYIREAVVNTFQDDQASWNRNIQHANKVCNEGTVRQG